MVGDPRRPPQQQLEVAVGPIRSLPGGLHTLSPGDHVGERYQILRLLACGGMGEVYEAFDEVLDEVVALKTIVLAALDSQRALDGLKAEVLLSRKVSHHNVCRILEFGVQVRESSAGGETIPFFTMEMLRGETLRQLLERRRRVPLGEAVPIVRQMLQGLTAIQAAGIVHRDLKPENVFLLEERPGSVDGELTRVVVMDFGLARSLDLPQSMASCAGDSARPAGTMEYMAPEQLRGSRPTVAFDVYALGTIMFELLAGQRPFAATDGGTLATALARLDQRAPLLSSVLPGADPHWEAVIDRCLARAPGDRYASIDEVRQALFGSTRSPAPGRSRNIVAAALLVGVLGVAATGLAVLQPGRTAVPPRAPQVEARVALPAPAPQRRPEAIPPLVLNAAFEDPDLGVPERKARRAAPTRGPQAGRGRTPAPPPENVAAMIDRAERMLVSGEGAAACALGEQARAIAPRAPAVYRFLGKCYMRLPDADKGRRHYRRYLELAPRDPDAVFVRAIVER